MCGNLQASPPKKRTNTRSFIEENHEYKMQCKEDQYNQPARPGQASQDLMSYWGTLCPYYQAVPALTEIQDTSSKRYP